VRSVAYELPDAPLMRKPPTMAAVRSRAARSLLRLAGVLALPLTSAAVFSLPTAALAYEAPTTLAGLTEQAVLASRLHRRLLQRFVYPLGIFEPLRLDLSSLPPARARDLYGRLVGLDPGAGYAPDWQQGSGRVYPVGRQHVLGWLAAGTVIENVPASRLRNHFFDPQTGRGLQLVGEQTRLSSSLQAVGSGVSSLRQLLAGAAVDGTGQPAPDWLLSADNDLGLPVFLRAYERSVLGEQPAERESALASALLSVGGLLSGLLQMGDPAFLRSDMGVALDGQGSLAVAERFGRAGVPSPGPGEAGLPQRLRDLFADGRGGGLAERTARRCVQPTRCYISDAPALLAETARYGQRLIDFLFRGELKLELTSGGRQLAITSVELPLGSGTLTLLGEQPEGSRRVLRELATVPTLVGGQLGEFSLTEAERNGTHRLVVLFRGRDRANEPIVTSAQVVMPHAQPTPVSPDP
jgi:hypothetical protein